MQGIIKRDDYLSGLLRLQNVDIYVTGSNSKMLTKTEYSIWDYMSFS